MSQEPQIDSPPRPPAGKTAVTGVLMGLANLVPGVSGGTMILAMGLYGEFIDSVADITALRFSARRLVFLGILGAFAAGTIWGLAGAVLYLLFRFDTAMYSLFIGMTLGGAPLLFRSLGRATVGGVVAVLAGVGLMIVVALTQQRGGIPQNTFVDLFAGMVAAITMVLPGISGSYMLLILGQYDRVVGAVDVLNLSIIIPVGIGVLAGVVILSNSLKYLLHHYERVTIGFLLGLLLGSVVGLWPFGRQPSKEVVERRSLGELVQYAEARGFAGYDAMDHEALVKYIGEHWDARPVGDYRPANVTTAILSALVGFAITFSLSCRGQSLNRSG